MVAADHAGEHRGGGGDQFITGKEDEVWGGAVRLGFAVGGDGRAGGVA